MAKRSFGSGHRGLFWRRYWVWQPRSARGVQLSARGYACVCLPQLQALSVALVVLCLGQCITLQVGREANLGRIGVRSPLPNEVQGSILAEKCFQASELGDARARYQTFMTEIETKLSQGANCVLIREKEGVCVQLLECSP